MTTKIPVELSSTPGIVDNSNATAITIDSSENVSLTGQITIGSGNNIINAGNMTVDVAGDITLDADGGDIKFEDAGTQWLNFGNAAGSSAVHIDTKVSNHDLKFRGNDGGSTITALTLDMSEAGTATFNNGVVVQGDLTVQGTTVTLNTATLDVEDKNITLNAGSGDTSGSADGAGITIQDAVNASTDASLTWRASDDKFIFSHSLRMFNHLELPDTIKLIAGDDNDLQIYHDGTNSYIQDAGTGTLRILSDELRIYNAAGNKIGAQFIQDGEARLRYDNNTKLATKTGGIEVTGNIANASGNMTIDVAGEIILDASDGIIRLKDDDTEFGKISQNSNNLRFFSTISDADILFQGNDGGSSITALTLDMSDSGTAIFNHDVQLGDDSILKIGTDGDLQLTHNNSNGTITNSTGNLHLDVAGDIILDADGGDIKFQDAGTDIFSIINNSNDAKLKIAVQDQDLQFEGNDGGSVFTALTLDMSNAGSAFFNHDIVLTDNGKVTFGAGSDLQIYHDGSNSFINEIGTGILYIQGSGTIRLRGAVTEENLIEAVENGAVSLYHDGSTKLATTSAGVDVTGDLKFNSGYGSSVIGYGVRAWVNFNGTGTVAIREDGNVSSITDNGTGDYTVNFATALPDTNYCVVGSGISVSSHPAVSLSVSSVSGAQATGSIRVVTAANGGSGSVGFAIDCSIISVAVIR